MSVLPVRHAWRSLRRTPAFSITAALTLVIGIGAAVSIFTVINGVLLRPLPYSNPNHAQQTSATYFTYKKLAHTIDGIAVYQEGAVNAAAPGGGSAPQRLTS